MSTESLPQTKPSGQSDATGEAHVPDLPQYVAKDYFPFVTESGAEKLSTSAVAPLVAAAHGYYTLAGAPDADAFIRENNLGAKRMTNDGPNGAKRFFDAATSRDVMVMPAHQFNLVLEARKFHRDAPVTVNQWRPHTPQGVTEANPKGIKYETPRGSTLPIFCHPSMPAEWVNGSTTAADLLPDGTTFLPPVLLAEGQLKADAALSGILRSALSSMGLDADDRLSIKPSDCEPDGSRSVAKARQRLHDLMLKIDPKKRVAVLGFLSSTTWIGKPEWTDLNMGGRQVWIGFDADVAENPNVYAQASRAWDYIVSKGGIPRLLSPEVVTGDEATAKAGLDDYLYDRGDWDTLVAGHLKKELPPKPVTEVAKPGDYKMNEDLTQTLKAEERTDSAGQKFVVWTTALHMGGKIEARLVERQTTSDEDLTGTFDTALVAEGESVLIKFKWTDPWDHGQPGEAVWRAPELVLTQPPSRWQELGLKYRMPMPREVAQLPTFPRRMNDDADGMVKAILGVQKGDVRPMWKQMGWVPVPGRDIPAFIVGNHVVADPGDFENGLVLPGVTEADISGVSKMGLDIIDPRPFDDADYQADLTADLAVFLDAYVNPENGGTWTDPAVMLLVLGAMFRPVMPLRPRVPLFLHGNAGSGKTATLMAVQAGWQAKVARSNTKKAFGSAADTVAATESILSQAVIWTYDDLAPSSSQSKADSDQDRAAAIIRSIFNGGGKRRSTATGQQQAVKEPRGLVVLSSENPLEIASAEQRVISVEFIYGECLHPDRAVSTDKVIAAMRAGVPARVVQGFVKWHRWKASQEHPTNGQTRWESWVSRWTEVLDEFEKSYTAELREMRLKSPTRPAEKMAEYALPLNAFAEMLMNLGWDDWNMVTRFTNLGAGALFDLVAAGAVNEQSRNPGSVLLDCLRTALKSKQVWIENADNGGTPPDWNGDTDVAFSLGWTKREDEWTHGHGACVGQWVVDRNGEGVVMFDHQAAFSTMKRLYPDRIIGGMSRSASWASLWAGGWAMPETDENGAATGWKRTVKRGQQLVTCRFKGAGKTDEETGVPVWIKTLLSDRKYGANALADPDTDYTSPGDGDSDADRD